MTNMSACRRCEQPFTPRSTGGRKQVYCSAQCRVQHHGFQKRKEPGNKPLTPSVPPNRNGGRDAVCEHCKSPYRTRSRGGGRRQRFCSTKCGRASYNERYPHKSREAELAKFGMTLEDYGFMLKTQKGVCAVCLQPPKNNSLAVDHDHATGHVRGLLCSPCNRHLGYYERFHEAMRLYLERPSTSFKVRKTNNDD